MVETSGVCIGIAFPRAGRSPTTQSIQDIPVNSECETIAQIAPVGNDARNDATLGLIGDQHVEPIATILGGVPADLGHYKSSR